MAVRILTRISIATICAALMAGCTPSQEHFVERGLLNAQRAKDAEGRVLKTTVCAMSIGAYHRINTDLEREALDVLCGGGDRIRAPAEPGPDSTGD